MLARLAVVLACPLPPVSLPFTAVILTLLVYQLLLPFVPVIVAVPAIGSSTSTLYSPLSISDVFPYSSLPVNFILYIPDSLNVVVACALFPLTLTFWTVPATLSFMMPNYCYLLHIVLLFYFLTFQAMYSHYLHY